MPIELIWPDGTITTGVDWEDLEAALRASQWRPYPSRRAFRHDMRKRAEVWSGVMPTGRARTSELFIKQLADAGLFMIIVTGEGGGTRG